MFWKHVKQRVRSLSLVTKLMILYSISTIGILAAISVFLYPTYLKIMQGQTSHLSVECVEKLMLSLLLSSLFAVLFGNLIARKGLNKLREFENKMEQITVNSLHETINIADWPIELSNLAKKFNAMLDRINTSYTQLSQFSSDIAHELRTPINNLQGITELALTRKTNSNEQQQLLEKYMQEYHQLSKLIEHLLFFARSDNGQICLNKETIQTRQEILNILDYYQAIADEKNIQVNCYGDACLQADLLLFKRVISNILSNSLKYTPNNGTIDIHLFASADAVEISIKDTGIGIDEHHLPNIFDRFYRVDSSRTTHTGGLGLGLAIVKSIVDLHKGSLSIASKSNMGTAINIQLQATQA